MGNYKVIHIPKYVAETWVIDKHYLHRMPSHTQYCFGLCNNKDIEGVAVYGPTYSRELNNGKAAFGGEELAKYSFELLRLVIESDNDNAASMLIGRSLKLLPQPAFVVSYADPNFGHIGYVYQATNWIYTGLIGKTRERTYKDTRTGEIIPPRTVYDLFGSRAPEKLPDYIKTGWEPAKKHRYITFIGNRRQIRKMKKSLVYPIVEYPKGETERHDTSIKVRKQTMLILE